MVGSDQVGGPGSRERAPLGGEGGSTSGQGCEPSEPLGQGQVPGLSFRRCAVSTDRLEAKMSTVRRAFPVLLLKTHLPWPGGVASCTEASVPKRRDNPTLLFSKALRSVHT